MEKKVAYLRIISAVLIIGSALYWIKNPESNVEPIIVIIGSVVGLIFSFKDLVSNKNLPQNDVQEIEPITVKLKRESVRCYGEWIDYGIQINFEIYFHEPVLLKRVFLDYEEHYGFGEKWTDRAQLHCTQLIEDDLLSNDLNTSINILDSQESLPELPLRFDEKSMLQVTFGGYVPGERLSDGWEGITLDNWTIVIEYNESDQVKVPVVLKPHGKSEKRATQWEFIGFVKNA
ncbi:hypothetical protein ABVD55_005142 [Vibrio harveyi]